MTFKASLLPQADGAGGTSTGQMLGSSTAGWKITKLNIPTASNGTTYGAGSANQVLMSNGSTVYWGTVSTADTKQNITLAATSKAFITAVTTTPTASAQGLAGVADTGVYLTATAGEISATDYSLNVSGAEKAYMKYNTTTNAIDFVFV